MSKISRISKAIAQWRVGASLFTVCPESGKLLAWDIDLPNGIRRVLYPIDFLQEGFEKSGYGGNQVLFPFTGQSIYKGTLDRWKSPMGEELPMPANGFAKDANYEIVHSDKTSLSVRLIPSPEMQQCYPFSYNFTVHYKFEELSIEIRLDLVNHDKIALPWSAGIAFDISVPWHPSLSEQNYQVSIPARKVFYMEPSGKLAPTKCLTELTSIDDPILVGRFHTKLKSSRIKLGPKGGEEDVTINIGNDIKGISFATVKTWKPTQYPFLRIETNMGLPNAAENSRGLNFVSPGDRGSFEASLNLL